MQEQSYFVLLFELLWPALFILHKKPQTPNSWEFITEPFNCCMNQSTNLAHFKFLTNVKVVFRDYR